MHIVGINNIGACASANGDAVRLGIIRLIALISKGNKYWSRIGYLEKKIAAWVVGALTSGEALYDEVKERVKDYLGKMLGGVLNEINKEELIRVAGEAAAKEIAKQILKRYNLDFPITNVASDTIVEELSTWIADLINEKASERLGRDVVIVTALFPPDTILQELDTFAADEINLKLGTSLTGVLFNANLIQELKTQVINRLQQELTNQFAQTKGQLINAYATQGGDDAVLKMQIASQVMTDALAIFSSFQIDGFPISAANYYSKNKKRIHNKMRQREYRRTHVEARHWVLR